MGEVRKGESEEDGAITSTKLLPDNAWELESVVFPGYLFKVQLLADVLMPARDHWRRQLWDTRLPASYFGDHSLYRLRVMRTVFCPVA